MEHEQFEKLALAGQWLCDVDMVPSPASPGRIESPWGAHSIGYIESGEFAGPRLQGKVLPGGGDWPALSDDGEDSYNVNVRAVWETDDGARIYVQYYGYIVVASSIQGGDVPLHQLDPADYYFRTAPTFRTGNPRYAWLNKVLCVGIGRFTEAGLGYRIFQLA